MYIFIYWEGALRLDPDHEEVTFCTLQGYLANENHPPGRILH